MTIHKDFIMNRLIVSFKIDGEGREYCHFRLRNVEGTDFPQNGRFTNIRYVKSDPYKCDDIHHFKVDYIYQYKDTTYQVPEENEGKEIITKKDTLTLAGYSECFAVAKCEKEDLQVQFTCNLKHGATVNPFINGIRGKWKLYRGYSFKTERVRGNVESGGYFKSFLPTPGRVITHQMDLAK
ncbi:MAG: hypothetical protein U5L09_15070 [Bacteroidales bacterium]|nr:hypothetical protein [Bacteroidales bacterium]